MCKCSVPFASSFEEAQESGCRHGPNQAPANYTALYDPEQVTYEPRLLCLAMISAVDEAIRRITDALKSEGLWNNLLVIFSSDKCARLPASVLALA